MPSAVGGGGWRGEAGTGYEAAVNGVKLISGRIGEGGGGSSIEDCRPRNVILADPVSRQPSRYGQAGRQTHYAGSSGMQERLGGWWGSGMT